MKAKRNSQAKRGRENNRPTCCAKLIEKTVRYADQSGKIRKIPLKTSTLAEARQVMNLLEPGYEWIIA